MEVHEAAEMYLETILVLKNRLGLVRSIDVALKWAIPNLPSALL